MEQNQNKQRVWMLERKVSLAAYLGDNEFKTMAKKDIIDRFIKDTGKKPEILYYTFHYNDYKCKHLQMVCMSKIPDFIIVTAPEDDIEQAVNYVIHINPHLLLREDIIGLNADDYVHNRITVKLRIEYPNRHTATN